jgi:hypothetical protein
MWKSAERIFSFLFGENSLAAHVSVRETTLSPVDPESY